MMMGGMISVDRFGRESVKHVPRGERSLRLASPLCELSFFCMTDCIVLDVLEIRTEP